MEIIGWIREGDRAACGGLVVEADQTCISHGRACAFKGAKVVCMKKCVIAEECATSAPHGRPQVLHGMKTSGGCPLISTLNDLDGVSNCSGELAALAFAQNPSGEWARNTSAEQTSQDFLSTNSEAAEPLQNRKFIAPVGSKTQEGNTEESGSTRVDAKRGDLIHLGTKPMTRHTARQLSIAALTAVSLLLIWLFTGVATGYSDEERRAYLFLKKYPTFQIEFPNPDDSESDYSPFAELHPETRDAITALCKYRYGIVSTEVAKIEECRQKPNRGAR